MAFANTKKSKELHLFIIWEKARHEEKTILEDIKKWFDIIKIYEVSWSKKSFSSNLTRFYGTNLPPGSGKEEHVGTGPFLLIIVEDKNPEYKNHVTSKGDAVVNSNTFLAKTRHRELTGGGHRIHATNTPQETEHDLTLLIGVNSSDFLKQIKSQPKKRQPNIEKLKQDVVGATGWRSIKELFYVLNATIDYIVVRNFEPLPENYYADQHGDIDILTDDYQQIQYIANARPVFGEPYRVHNKARVNNEWVLFDFRFLGDHYYDAAWERDLLKNKTPHNQLYVPGKEDYFYSLLYHALIHKPKIATDYIERLQHLRPNKEWGVDEHFFASGRAHKILGQYLAKKSYSLTIPQDKSVYVNQANFKLVKKAMWYKSPFKYGIRKAKRYLPGPNS